MFKFKIIMLALILSGGLCGVSVAAEGNHWSYGHQQQWGKMYKEYAITH